MTQEFIGSCPPVEFTTGGNKIPDFLHQIVVGRFVDIFHGVLWERVRVSAAHDRQERGRRGVSGGGRGGCLLLLLR